MCVSALLLFGAAALRVDELLPVFSFPDSLLETEPSSLGNLQWVTMATEAVVKKAPLALHTVLCSRGLMDACGSAIPPASTPHVPVLTGLRCGIARDTNTSTGAAAAPAPPLV